MNTAYLEAFMLGYIKAALKEQLCHDEVDALYEEAERCALESIRRRVSAEFSFERTGK
ncbi:hypothetical protein ACL1HT_04460 [Corynebacterium striatum]|nr:hypothetical protein [Corynebacterium striatum]HAT6493915.1 hypothetical protein [Corynebacterium striatum]HAT6496227.1 hypothetical protein [Corynebacterium striatum]HAT6620145.1 hypothetical protein [Corynebacterium striatum]HCG3138953.1 hypothetical protein [Corynebacterium striatum]